MSKSKGKRPTDPLGRRIRNLERVLTRREQHIAKIRRIAEEEVLAIEARSADTKIILEALKRGQLK